MPTQPTALVSSVSSAIGQIDQALGKLTNAVNGGLRLLPFSAPAGVQAEWGGVLGFWQNLRDTVENLIESPGMPGIRVDAVTWNRDIGGGTSALAGRADPSFTRIQDYWEGEAVEAYLNMLPAQRIALEQVKETFADPAGTMLVEMGDAIDSFWRTVSTQFWVLYGAIVGATIIGLAGFVPFAVAAVIGALVFTIEQVTSAYSSLRSEATHHKNILEQKLFDNLGFPEGHWPQSTV